MPWNKGDTLRFSSLPLKIDGAAKVQPRGEFGAVNRMNKSAMPVKGESIPQVSSGERTQLAWTAGSAGTAQQWVFHCVFIHRNGSHNFFNF